ncbi:MAG TPA: alanine dehydrogenase [Gammaproteobacteria bacterium]|nr:alanine dehydrogenase [Gammaproteobacteria bacterium]
MRIGIPKEIKDHEYRVGGTPSGVKTLVEAGHEVVVEHNAGAEIGFGDEAYRAAGAEVADRAAVYACPMVVKVKEPQPSEYGLLREGQVLFAYLHLAPDPKQAAALLERKIVGIAYETVTDARGHLPLLVPMSEVAGRLAIQAGADALQMINGGRGVLLGGVPGVPPGRVLIIGGGMVGTQAARMAMGLGADVTLLDVSLDRLRELDDLYGPRLKTRYSDSYTLAELLPQADLVVGAVLIPGGQAPRLVTRDHLKTMKRGAVIVDVAIDQGGCVATSHPTTHSDPTYIVDGVVHYCVANMPGAVAHTSTWALTHATLPYVLELAGKGYRQALADHPGLRDGLNVCFGKVTNEHVAADLGYDYVPPQAALAGG